MCNCYDEMAKKIKTKVIADSPEGSDEFDIEIGGYLFGLSDEGLTHRSSNSLKISYITPKKSGGMKKVSKKSFIRATYCPFCGVQYA